MNFIKVENFVFQALRSSFSAFGSFSRPGSIFCFFIYIIDKWLINFSLLLPCFYVVLSLMSIKEMFFHEKIFGLINCHSFEFLLKIKKNITNVEME